MRWRWGDTNPVSVNLSSETSVSMGDLVYLDGSGVVHPASDLSFSSSLAATQSLFRSQFLGVAMQAKPAGTAGKIRVATSGTFEFPCASATFTFGTLIGPDVNSQGSQLENQKIVEVESTRCAIGRVERPESDNVEKAYVRICSTIFTGGLTIDALPVE